jgi:apolipoprotein N-acyltransferase
MMPSQGTTEARREAATTPHRSAAGAPAAVPTARRQGVRLLALALTTAGLLWLSYFPVAFGPLAWLALVPLLVLVRSPARPRAVYLCAYAGGLAFYAPALQWLRVADDRMYFTWAFLATYCALYFPLAVWLWRLLDRRTALPLTVTVPVVWTALEFFRSNFIGGFATTLLGSTQHDWPGGFGWYCLSHSQHAFLRVIQVSDLAGAYGVTFLVAAVNGQLFEALYARPWFRRQFVAPDAPARCGTASVLAQAAAVLALLVATLAYGSWRLSQDTFAEGPRLALVQGNIDQRIRNDAGGGEAEARDKAASLIVRDYMGLSDLAARYRPDLIVWPETSWPYEWVETAPGVPDPEIAALAREYARRWRTDLLAGMNVSVGPSNHPLRYNSAVRIDREGRLAGRYDKIHRVPFGEYVPLRETLPFMTRLAPYDFDYSVHPGAEHTRFTVEGRDRQNFSYGVVICYEDTDPVSARPYGGGDGKLPADFVLNASNDGWFNGTSEHDQHLAICRFRAVECRRCVARAVNMGISAVIDGNGRVLRPQPQERPTGAEDSAPGAAVWLIWPKQEKPAELPVAEWGQYKKVAGVLLAVVPIDRRVSLYARWGDWLPWACWAFIVVAVGWAVVRPTRVAKPQAAATD